MTPEEIEKRHEEMRASLNEPDSWMEMARTLRHAAEVLAARIKPALRSRHELHERKRWADYDEEDKKADRAASKDAELARVSEMLFQMSYENAFKALLCLQKRMTNSLSVTHDLEKLRQAAGIQVEEMERQYLGMLSNMNQLGRYKVTSKNLYGTLWHDELKDRRTVIDEKIKAAWLTSGGSAWMAQIADDASP